MKFLFFLLDADDEDDELVRKFIYGPGIDEPIMMIAVDGGETKYYYHFDGLGSVIALSNNDGDIVERYSYDVFGDPNRVSNVGNPYLFTGRRYDSEAELYYYRSRYYKPSIGRFIQTDPIGYAAGHNLYTYCGNNPLNWVDPYGLDTYSLSGFLSGQFGWSGLRQSGLVVDTEWNVAWQNITGIGAGTPDYALGLSLTYTNADTVFNLESFGCQTGGSWVLGADGVFGNNYEGFEINVAVSPLPEIHGQFGDSAIYQLFNAKDLAKKSLEGAKSAWKWVKGHLKKVAKSIGNNLEPQNFLN